MSAVVIQTSALSQLAGASGPAPELVLQPGTVIDARVLAVREGLARIFIAGLAIEVLSEVALQPGANLKLAVSQTAEGNVRLAVVSPQTPLQGQASASPPAAMPNTGATSSTTANVSAAAQTVMSRISSAPTSPEAIAVSHAVQASASKQAGLSPLFANLPVIVASKSVPLQLQTAASQLLAARAPLDGKLTADDLRQAFQKSGLFLEATLARGAAPVGAPDLKAALVVFRQVLTNWLGQAAPVGQNLLQNPPQAVVQPAIARPAVDAAVWPLSPGLAAKDQIRAAASPPVAHEPAEPSGEIARTAIQASVPHAARSAGTAMSPTTDDPAATPAAQSPTQMGAARQASDPAPPLRGALPSPQPVALPSLAPDAPPASMGRQLLEQTDAALARQTLLQVASLPDRPELAGPSQNSQSRWAFEIPFATPQGTAMAQFEIARDGGNEVEAASSSRVWRARFSLDVEPAGPVHALVSLVGDKTAVRMWAERPETAAQLRANADTLSLALRQAELEPGDIVVGEGAPPQPKLPAGRFLDRAT